jgi:hypothetical protein
MSLQVSFRVVGLFCYFENIQLSGVTETSTVQEVMDAIAAAKPDFSYKSVDMGGKQIVSEIDYNFTNSSTTPYNTSGRPANGPRDLSISINKTSLIWQYYRSVTGTINGSVCEIKLITQGQPSFATTPLNTYDPYFGQIPEGFIINTYNLTWRLVQIQMSPENQANYMMAIANSLQK